MLRNLWPFRRTPTFQDLTSQWLDESRSRLRPKWHNEAKRLSERDLAPLGSQRADRITRRDVSHILTAIESPAMANKCQAVVSVVFSWAIATGRLDCGNPAKGLRKRPVPSRERTLSEAELSRVWTATMELEDYGRIVRLLLLTGQRKDEIGALRWSEICFDRNEITLPGSRTKNRRPHVIPLAPLAIAQLPARRDECDHLFGRFQGRSFGGWSKCKARLDKALGAEMPNWRLHDLRRTFITQCSELGVAEPHILEACVNHISGHRAGVAGIYNRATYSAAKRAALERWADEVRRIVGAKDQRPGGFPLVALVTARPGIR